MKFLVSLIFVMVMLHGQVSVVFAAPEHITGTVQSITLETNIDTAVTTVLITLLDNENSQTVRVNIDSALTIGLVVLGGDGNPVINEAILGQLVEIDSSTVIEDQLHQHPVGDALATFFSDIIDLDYETIMAVHDEGTGFGVIAQALWLTRKLGGDAVLFLMIIDAKKNNDFSAFALGEGGTAPENWGQFKKAVMEGKKGKPGIVMANNNHNENNNGFGNGHGKDKEKNRDRENNGRGNGHDQ